MKRLALGLLAGFGLLTAAMAQQRTEGFGLMGMPATPAPAVGAELIVVPTPLGDRGQMLAVIDPRQRVLCVYHIELPTGKISLKSVRNLQWDLQIEEFNNVSPSPKEIRSQLEPR